MEQDKMSYGSETSPFTLPDVDTGWSLARLIKGFDTNSASDFWANPTPNPGTNPEKAPEFITSSQAIVVATSIQEATPSATATPSASL